MSFEIPFIIVLALAYNVQQPRNGTLNALALHGIKERAVE
jgi:hypothetical protein